jgi:DNA mismatch endonuclease (patch repair protein)
LATTPQSNSDFWQEKFRANGARDRRVVEELEVDGWAVVIAWQCEVAKSPDEIAGRIASLVLRRRQRAGAWVADL